MRMLPWMEAIGQDLGFALRSLRRSPGFTFVVVLTFALGIGANAALFTLADRLLLRPPAGVHDAGGVARLYAIERSPITGERAHPGVGYDEYAALRADSAAFSGVAAYLGPARLTLAASDARSSRRVELEVVTPSFFPVLGVRPALGRFMAADENRAPNGTPVIVLSHALWQSQFGGDPAVLGKTVHLDSAGFVGFNPSPYTIIGVAPEHFRGVDLDAAEAWIPITAAVGVAFSPEYRKARLGFATFPVIARLRTGVTRAQASAAATLDVQRAGGMVQYTPGLSARAGSIIATRGPGFLGQQAAITMRLLGVAAIVLLIACANIANLLLARGARRRREIAVRLALGISRRRLVEQLFTESMLLTLLGGMAALLIAAWGGYLLRALLVPDIAWAGAPVDARVVVFTLGITILAGLLAGLLPALQASHPDLTTSLKAGWRAPLGRPPVIRTALLVAQVALSVVLLTGAGLFVRSLLQVRDIDLGVDTNRLIVARVSADLRKGNGKLPADYYVRLNDAMERIRAIPGVANATLMRIAPLTGMSSAPMAVPGRDSLPHLRRSGNFVAPEFFATVGVQIVKGRGFVRDDQSGARVAIVNETMARAVWPGESALGKCVKLGFTFRLDTMPCSQIVGVAHDTHQLKIIEQPFMQIYQPLPLVHKRSPSPHSLVVRSAGEPEPLVGPIRVILAREFPHDMMVRVETLRESIAPQLRPWRLGVATFGAFGLLALLIAAVGVFSAVSYAVVQRTHEMGVRIALGARAADVTRLVLGQSVRVTMLGVAIGMVLAVAAGTLIASILYDTRIWDPLVFGGVAFVLVAVASVASLVPAHRATRVDPMFALRTE